MKELSAVWHDRPSSAMDTAIYWTEFVGRTKNYTFRSSSVNVPMYQYFYLDIITLLVSVLLIIMFIFKFILSILRSKPQKTPVKVKTK